MSLGDQYPDKLPKGWIATSLSDLLLWPKDNIVDGPFGSNLKASEYQKSGVPVLRIQNINRFHYVHKNIKFVTRKKAAELERHSFTKGDIIITKLGDPLGKACVLPESAGSGIIVADLVRLRLDHDLIDKAWLCYAINSDVVAGQLRALTKGTTRPRVNLSHVRTLALLLPPRAEQERIVSTLEELLSELDKGIESLTTAREQLTAYRRSVLKHAFAGKLTAQWRQENKDKLEPPDRAIERIAREREADYRARIGEWRAAVKAWEDAAERRPKPRKPTPYKPPKVVTQQELELLPAIPSDWCFVRLSDVAAVGSGMSVSASRKIDDPIEVPYLRVANVQRGFLDLSEMKAMRIERDQLPALQLRKWDVLFNEGGDRDKLGRGWIWQNEVQPCITQNHVFRASLYVASQESAKVLSYWGNTFGQRYFEETGKQTTNLASINRAVLSDFPVPLIPNEEQVEICRQIDRLVTIVDAQDREIETALKHAELTRQSILKRAFSGHLVAQDANDEPASVLLERIKAEIESRTPARKRSNAKKKSRKQAETRKEAA